MRQHLAEREPVGCLQLPDRRVEIGTALEKKPVRLVSEYRDVNDGPTYQARAVLQYPEKQVELTVENFEYQHVGASR